MHILYSVPDRFPTKLYYDRDDGYKRLIELGIASETTKEIGEDCLICPTIVIKLFQIQGKFCVAKFNHNAYML